MCHVCIHVCVCMTVCVPCVYTCVCIGQQSGAEMTQGKKRGTWKTGDEKREKRDGRNTHKTSGGIMGEEQRGGGQDERGKKQRKIEGA